MVFVIFQVRINNKLLNMTKLNKIFKEKTEKQLIIEFIRLFKTLIEKKEKNERFSFALPGGTSPINLYKYLSKAKINWKKIDLFLVDERFVAYKSNNLNFNTVKKYLINKINISKKNIFFINTNKENVFETTKDYEEKLKNYFKNRKIQFDLILLGMGLDGHIASIFSDNLDIKDKDLVCTVLKEDFERISLKLETINKAKKIILWLNNKRKSRAYRKIKSKKNVPVNKLNKKKVDLFLVN